MNYVTPGRVDTQGIWYYPNGFNYLGHLGIVARHPNFLLQICIITLDKIRFNKNTSDASYLCVIESNFAVLYFDLFEVFIAKNDYWYNKSMYHEWHKYNIQSTQYKLRLVFCKVPHSNDSKGIHFRPNKLWVSGNAHTNIFFGYL